MEALLVIDVQNDFMPTGSLPVPDGDSVVAVANLLMPHYDFVVATQDWHPPGHLSFASNHSGAKPGDVIDLAGIEQVLWPDHCVQDTAGASFHSGLDVGLIDQVVRKGTDIQIDSYSGFFDNNRMRSTGLSELLAQRGVTQVTILGLATDYCVKFSALDAAALGLDTTVVLDGCRAVEMSPGDADAALESMRNVGCHIKSSADILAR